MTDPKAPPPALVELLRRLTPDEIARALAAAHAPTEPGPVAPAPPASAPVATTTPATSAPALIATSPGLPLDRLWTVHQVAAFLGRSTSWVYKAAERDELPRARGLGWGLRFVPAEIAAWARGEAAPGASVVPLRQRGGGGGR